MKRVLWLLLAIAFSPAIKAQSWIDSLKLKANSELASSNFDNAAAWLAAIGNEFLANSEYDSALAYYHKALGIAKGEKVRAATFNSIGIVHNNRGQGDSCILYYEKALDSYNLAGDTLNSAVLELNISIWYKNRGLYDRALETALEALRKLEQLKADKTLASLYNNIGTIYFRLSNYELALKNYRLALSIREEIGHSRGVGQSYTNIGEVFIARGEYDSALFNLFNAAEIKRTDPNPSELGSTLNLIGQTYLNLQQPDRAEPYLLEALRIKKKSGERAIEGAILNNLGQLYLGQRRFIDAAQILDEAEVLVRGTGALNELKKNLELRISMSKLTGRLSTGLEAAEELLVVKDSLLNREKAESLQAMQIRYETEKKDQQIRLLHSEREARMAEIRAKQVWIGALAIVLGIATLATIVIVLQYRAVSRGKRMTELLLQELHHRVKNNLQVLTTLFHLPYQNITDKAALEAVKDGEGRVNAMALIHGMLSPATLTRTISAQDYLQQLTEFLSKSYGFENRNGALFLQCDGVQLDIDKAIPVGLIVNELVSNSMKYAFLTQPEPAIRVVLEVTARGTRLSVSDNGSGFKSPYDSTANTTFGLRLITLLAKELNGKLAITNDHGVNFELTIPNS